MTKHCNSFARKSLETAITRYRFVPFWLLAFAGAPQVGAQEVSEDIEQPQAAAVVPSVTELERIEVTGSAIRRADAETAVPVTILRTEQLREQGVTTTQELVSRIVGSQTTTTAAQSVGSGTGGASFADMRGIGANKTLVLLNGRRLANNAIDGSAVDLNTIPFAAIDRVEILRDGASALYGTDAIGGVINFITKKSVTDGQLSFGYNYPTESGGGENRNYSGSWGFGDLQQDRFNVFGVVNYDKQANLTSIDRDFAEEYAPGRGLNGTSGTAYPGNYTQGPNATNPLANTGCNGPNLVASNGLCRFTTREYIDLIPETEKTSVFSMATYQLAEDHDVSLDYFWARNNNTTTIAPSLLTGVNVGPDTPFYPGNGSTPLPTSFDLITTEPVTVGWRETEAGGRLQKDQNTGQRLQVVFDGNLAGVWDYNVGVSYNENKVISSLRGGYLNDIAVEQGIENGIINPFGPQTQEGLDLINSIGVSGDYMTAVGRVKTVDGRVGREIGDWFGAGPAAIAVGGEFRKEDFHAAYDTDITSLVGSLGVSGDPTVSGDRDVEGQYAELNVPVFDSLELTAAIRHDKYSDVGSTTNPKYSFRYQPLRALVIRGAYSEGFRAPSLYELHDPTYITYSAGSYNDPVLCPGGTPSNGGVANRDCDQQVLNETGGNTELEPETARNTTFGFVYQPLRNLSVAVDLWWIDISGQIAEFPETTIFQNQDLYSDRIVRGPNGSIDHIVTGLSNQGNVKTSGVDLSFDYLFPTSAYGQFGLSMQGTYVTRYDYQQEADGPYIDNVGDFQGNGVIFRWKHNLVGTWNYGPYRAAVTNRYMSGYNDYDTEGNPDVSSYMLWDLSTGYNWRDMLDLDLGIKNLFDRDPPFTNQAVTFQSGYDPRYTDPLGRTLYTRMTYRF
ncbi:TonB-dependent receptor [Stutzerimonas stutzeri]|uniref:TonB-dependent receptor n=1 Tax=Stutzerimonas stutzeri TaxID=316 RepID=UPI00210C2B73|nr:TonB-dependent receptor [Stutzerimonas stutzeri]MCQ4319747.1 TonB-dependent receptor [Stutzerimonas stutzeri]